MSEGSETMRFSDGQFWKRKYIKRSRATHMTYFPSKQTSDWTESIFCHTLASSGWSSLNFGTLWGISPGRE
jgi:hypothetical protein